LKHRVVDPLYRKRQLRKPPQSRRLLLMVVATTVLCGCVPMTSKYLRIEAPGARYFHSSCRGGSGPPSVVYYPYHGIFISLDVTNVIALGLHLPAGTEAELDGHTVRITGVEEKGAVEVTLPIRATEHGALGSRDPPEFQGMRDPYSFPDQFGPLTGESDKKGRYLWYLFVSETDPTLERATLLQAPPGLLRGTVELPPMTINGVRYESQMLPFERRTYAELSPVNC